MSCRCCDRTLPKRTPAWTDRGTACLFGDGLKDSAMPRLVTINLNSIKAGKAGLTTFAERLLEGMWPRLASLNLGCMREVNQVGRDG